MFPKLTLCSLLKVNAAAQQLTLPTPPPSVARTPTSSIAVSLRRVQSIDPNFSSKTGADTGEVEFPQGLKPGVYDAPSGTLRLRSGQPLKSCPCKSLSSE